MLMKSLWRLHWHHKNVPNNSVYVCECVCVRMSWDMKQCPRAKNIEVTNSEYPAYLEASLTCLKQYWSYELLCWGCWSAFFPDTTIWTSKVRTKIKQVTKVQMLKISLAVWGKCFGFFYGRGHWKRGKFPRVLLSFHRYHCSSVWTSNI